jgi:hypothetical protein
VFHGKILYPIKLGNFIAKGNEEIQQTTQASISDPTGNEASANPGIFQGKLRIFNASCRFLLSTIVRCYGNSVV